MMNKEELLKKPEQVVEKINVKGFEFHVKTGLTGLQLYNLEKQISAMTQNIAFVKDENEIIAIPEEIRYIICLLHLLVEEPKLTLEEWGLLFNRKPQIFLVLAKKVADIYFGGGDLSAFFSEEISRDVLSNG